MKNFLAKFFKSFRRNAPETKPYASLEHILGYSFKDSTFLTQALSHRSFVHSQKEGTRIQSNERLEFLGDSVLNAIVTDHLFHGHPDSEEGHLSKMKSLVVSARVLSLCAEKWRLGEFMLLSRSEEKAGGRKRPSILADAYEAVLGAVYLDGGFESARALVTSSLVPILSDVLGNEDFANYKSRLLEFTQAQGFGAPYYEVLEETGPEHQKIFVVAVMVQNEEWGRGKGASKKAAEQAGARVALNNHAFGAREENNDSEGYSR